MSPESRLSLCLVNGGMQRGDKDEQKALQVLPENLDYGARVEGYRAQAEFPTTALPFYPQRTHSSHAQKFGSWLAERRNQGPRSKHINLKTSTGPVSPSSEQDPTHKPQEAIFCKKTCPYKWVYLP